MPGELPTKSWEVVNGSEQYGGRYKDKKLAFIGANATNDSLDQGEGREVADAQGTLAEAREIEKRSRVNAILDHGGDGLSPEDDAEAQTAAERVIYIQKTVADMRAEEERAKKTESNKF